MWSVDWVVLVCSCQWVIKIRTGITIYYFHDRRDFMFSAIRWPVISEYVSSKKISHIRWRLKSSASLIFLHKILVPAALNIRVSRAAPLADWILLCFSFLGASERHEWLCSSQHGAEDAPPRTGNMEEWARKGRGCTDLLYFNKTVWEIAFCNMILLSCSWMSVFLCVCAHSLLLILHIRAALIGIFTLGMHLLTVSSQKCCS